MAKTKITKVVKDTGIESENIYLDYCIARLKNGFAEVAGNSYGNYTLVQDANNYHDISTLPEKYRPNVAIYFLGASINGDLTFRMRITTDGKVSYLCPHSGINYWMYDCLYPTA